MRDRVEVVTGRALRFGLLPVTKPDDAGRELLPLAGGEGGLLRRAIERVEGSLDVPMGQAGRQVVGMLEAALAMVEPRGALSCVSH